MANCKDEIKRITKDLVDKYVKGLCDNIKKMNTEPDFVRNDYVRGKKADHHIMYKLNCDGNLWLEGDDGRKYEFLVEFDKKDFAYGIYFGCKCILNENADVITQVEDCRKEWDGVRPYMIDALNHTFEDFDFSKRDIPTNNVNDSTYWPFWFRLGENEDVNEVAAVAVRIIMNTYKWFFESKKTPYIKAKKRGRKKNISINTRYTHKAYENVLKEMDDKMYWGHAKVYFENFLELLTEKGIIEPFRIYEKCWVVNGWENREFVKLIQKFCGLIRKERGGVKVSWNLFSPIILTADQEIFGGMNRQLVDDREMKVSSLKEIESIIEELKERVKGIPT